MPKNLTSFQISEHNVIEYLNTLNIGLPLNQKDITVEIRPAKNFNLLVSLPSGEKLLVKQERQTEDGKTFEELINEWKFRCFIKENSRLNFLEQQIPKVFHFSSIDSILVVEYLDKYEDLSELYVKETRFPLIIPQNLGNILANLHKFSSHCDRCKNSFQPNFIYTDVVRELDQVRPEIFGMFSPDGIKFVTLYQRYDSLRQAIADLRANWSPTCLVHGDFKLNNILCLSEIFNKNAEESKEKHISNSAIRVIDWERCCWGDPVHDFGTLIASYLLIWFNSLVIDNSISINESLKMAAVPLDLLQPSIKAFYESYIEVFPELLEERPDLQKQIVQHTGFSLIRQIQAALQYEHRLGNLSICMLQVAKSLLCRPGEFIPTIFGK